jgi:hypothetical protein
MGSNYLYSLYQQETPIPSANKSESVGAPPSNAASTPEVASASTTEAVETVSMQVDSPAVAQGGMLKQVDGNDDSDDDDDGEVI